MGSDDGMLLSSPQGGDGSAPGAVTTPGTGSTPVQSGSGGISRSEQAEIEATIEAEVALGDQGHTPVDHGYDLGDLLGRGGEGEVRAARQLAFGRTVAIKRVRSEGLDAKRLRRFHAEALVTAYLEHPNIIPIYDFRIGDNGEMQLVMKQVVGMTWKDLLRPRNEEQRVRSEAMSRNDHLDILLKVCDAIGFAHARGFLHRDLKPENVMVGEHGEVLVMDWGCAVCLRKPAPHPIIPTVQDLESVSGTPAFMAPEQARNDTAHMGPVSDVYLLGGILYQILTGRPPHRGATVREAMAAATRGEVIPPAERAGKAVDEELAAIALAALHADPDKRTPSAVAFAAALRSYRSHAEALVLLREARKRLQASKRDTVEAEESFRRALSACEQAIELWPEHQGARRLLHKTAQAYAEHALHHAAYRIARTMATTAGQAAQALGDVQGQAVAAELAKKAVRGEAETRSRERTVRQLRFFTTWGGSLAALCLAMGFVWAWRSSARATSALAQAQTNLGRFEAERTQRLERERLAVPALIAQAREAVAARDFATALSSVDAGLAFEPDHAAARMLRIRVLIVLDRRQEAVADLDRHLLAHPDDGAARQLRDICRHGGEDAKTQQAIADLFLKQGASAEAEALFTGVDQQETAWRERLAQAWPGFDQRWLTRRDDGLFLLNIPRGRAAGIVSLEPLKGIPLVRLEIFDSPKLRDISPLAGMALENVKLSGCGIRDLSPLEKCRLRVLELNTCDIVDLEALRGMPIEELDLSGNGIKDLTVLAGMPLRRLSLWNCAEVTDLAPLRNARLEWVSLGGSNRIVAPKVVSLRPLEGQPIHFLDLRYVATITDFQVIENIRPKRLLLEGTRITDLSPLWSLGLQQLSLTSTDIDDLSVVAKHPLEQIDFPMQVTRGLPDLRGNTALKRINRLPAEDFWILRDAGDKLAARNKDFNWAFVTGKIENGILVELDINRARVADLTPLRGLPLRRLSVWSNQIADGRPLRGMPLREFIADGNLFTDIAWLDQSPIEELRVAGSKVSDLSPLRKKHLRILHVEGTNVRDLRPALLPTLEELTCTPKSLDPVSIPALRNLKTIKRIGVAYNQIWEAAEFWQRYDRGEFK